MTSMENTDTMQSLNDISLEELAQRQQQQNIYVNPPVLQNQKTSSTSSLQRKNSKHDNKDTTTKGKYTLNDFQILRTLGTGSFGRVHLARSIHNGRFYAMKTLKKERVVNMKQIEHTNDERRMLKLAQHHSSLGCGAPSRIVIICL